MDEMNGNLNLGICKQAVMKLDSFVGDIHELIMDEGTDDHDRETFTQITETAGNMMAAIVNIVSREMNEEDFVAETIDMDEIDGYPEDDRDLMDDDID